MSTRANVIIKDSYDSLWFYRHSDGYPEVTLPSLQRFMDWLDNNLIRDNVGQAAGWLIRLGADEYDNHELPDEITDSNGFSNWKVGAYEPTVGQHSDIEHLYTIDLDKRTLTHKEV